MRKNISSLIFSHPALAALFLLFFLTPATSARPSMQDAENLKVNVNVRDTPLKEVFRMISQQTGLEFFGSAMGTDGDVKVSVNADGSELKQLLNNLLLPIHYSWSICGKVIIVRRKAALTYTGGNKKMFMFTPLYPAICYLINNMRNPPYWHCWQMTVSMPFSLYLTGTETTYIKWL